MIETTFDLNFEFSVRKVRNTDKNAISITWQKLLHRLSSSPVRPDEMNKSVNLSDSALYLFGTGLPGGLYQSVDRKISRVLCNPPFLEIYRLFQNTFCLQHSTVLHKWYDLMRFLREEIYLFFSRTDLCLKYRFIIPWDYPYIRVAHKMNLDQFRVHLHSETIFSTDSSS